MQGMWQYGEPGGGRRDSPNSLRPCRVCGNTGSLGGRRDSPNSLRPCRVCGNTGSLGGRRDSPNSLRPCRVCGNTGSLGGRRDSPNSLRPCRVAIQPVDDMGAWFNTPSGSAHQLLAYLSFSESSVKVWNLMEQWW